jgi:hypothetical protein
MTHVVFEAELIHIIEKTMSRRHSFEQIDM